MKVSINPRGKFCAFTIVPFNCVAVDVGRVKEGDLIFECDFVTERYRLALPSEVGQKVRSLPLVIRKSQGTAQRIIYFKCHLNLSIEVDCHLPQKCNGTILAGDEIWLFSGGEHPKFIKAEGIGVVGWDVRKFALVLDGGSNGKV